MMLQPQLEAMSPDERTVSQTARLRDLVERLRASSSRLWSERLAGVDARDLDLDALGSLPFTVKSDLRDLYPWGALITPLEATVRAHASSGTSGKPTIVAYTAEDVRIFAEVVARSLAAAGGGPDDVLQVSYGYGLFTGGLGLHYGGERLGATVIPASGGNTALQLDLLADLGVHGLACTPSFAMLLAERARDTDVTGLRVRYLVCGAEPWSAAFRDKLQDAWAEVTGAAVTARDIYGLSEVIGPGVAQECVEAPGGLHVFDDHFLPEIVDPDSGEPVSDGERGELVLTTLTKQAMPVLRYRTGDVTSLDRAACDCGRTHPRIARIEGRTDDMLIIRGVNVFPRQIEAVLLDEPALNGAYVLIVDRRETLNRLEIRAETAEGSEPTEDLRRSLTERLESALRVRADLRLEPAFTLPRTEVGKVRRVYERTSDADPVAGA